MSAPLDWYAISAELVHPIKVGVLEAFQEDRRRALSPVDLERLLRQSHGASLGIVSYHVRQLCARGLLECVRVEPTGGSISHYYAPTPRARAAAPAAAPEADRLSEAARTGAA